MVIVITDKPLSGFYLAGQTKNIPLYEGVNIIRRQRLPGAKFMSKMHCVIYIRHTFVMLRDYSSNGTWINNQSFIKHASILLNNNDEIALGSHLMKFTLKKAEIILIE